MLLLNTAILTEDISSSIDIITYTLVNTTIIQPVIQITNLSGDGGNYQATISINGNILVPDRPVLVAHDQENVALTGRQFIVNAGQTLVISLKGGQNDSNATIRVFIYDVTPLTAADYAEQATTPIINAIETALPTLNITVSRETRILSPSQRNVAHVPDIIPQSAVSDRILAPKPR